MPIRKLTQRSGGSSLLARGQDRLRLDGALDGFDRALELSEHAISAGIGNSASMGSD
jgi:hypothetical protein